MNYQYCSKTSVKLFPEHYQVINAQRETCVPCSKSQNCGVYSIPYRILQGF